MKNKILSKLRTSRIKSLCLHPTKPIIILCMYDGTLSFLNTHTFLITNTLKISSLPLRTCTFINNTLLVGCDDGNIYILENESLINNVQAHSDFIRHIITNGSSILSCSDDTSIKLWQLKNNTLSFVKTYQGHPHFVMGLEFIDEKRFISGSLDSTLKVWNLTNEKEITTLVGHKDGINSVTKCNNYLISVGDDFTAKIWDNYKCIYTIRGHTKNINKVKVFRSHFITGAEDGTIRVYDKKTWKLDISVNVGMERVWDIEMVDSKLFVACDEGLVVMSYGDESFNCTMFKDRVYYNINENLKLLKVDNLALEKDLSFLDYCPRFLKVCENGKFIALGNEGEYLIYNVLGFRYRSKGPCDDFFFTMNNTYIVSHENTIAHFDEGHNEIAKFVVKGMKKVIGVYLQENFIFCCVTTVDDKTNLLLNGKVIARFESLFNTCLFADSVILLINDNQVQIYAFDPENYTFSESTDFCDDINELVLTLSRCIKSYYLHKDVFFYISNDKLSYVSLKGTTLDIFDYQYMNLKGKLAGVFENNIYYFDSEMKIKKLEFNLNFVLWQSSVIRKEVFVFNDPEYNNRCVDFLISKSQYRNAFNICTDDNTKFDLLLKLKEYESALKITSSGMKLRLLMKELISEGLYENAAECAFKAKDFNSLFFLNVLVNNKYDAEILKGCSERSIEFWMAMKMGMRCGEMIKGTLFEEMYNEYNK